MSIPIHKLSDGLMPIAGDAEMKIFLFILMVSIFMFLTSCERPDKSEIRNERMFSVTARITYLYDIEHDVVIYYSNDWGSFWVLPASQVKNPNRPMKLIELDGRK